MASRMQRTRGSRSVSWQAHCHAAAGRALRRRRIDLTVQRHQRRDEDDPRAATATTTAATGEIRTGQPYRRPLARGSFAATAAAEFHPSRRTSVGSRRVRIGACLAVTHWRLALAATTAVRDEDRGRIDDDRWCVERDQAARAAATRALEVVTGR